jgi:hypothetical protein
MDSEGLALALGTLGQLRGLSRQVLPQGGLASPPSTSPRFIPPF